MDAVTAPLGSVTLRPVTEDDLAFYFDHQADPEATEMANFPARDWADHLAHWHKILSDETVVTRTVLLDREVAGSIVSWLEGSDREVGYWIGNSYWGKGVATAALSQFLEIVTTRPLYAHVACHNAGSIRVLEKCGFRHETETDDGAEVVLVLSD